MSRKGTYKMSIKILELYLVLGSIFIELVEFSLSSTIVKIAVTNKTLVKTYISTVTFRSDRNYKNERNKTF